MGGMIVQEMVKLAGGKNPKVNLLWYRTYRKYTW